MAMSNPNHFQNHDEESLYHLINALSQKAGIQKTPEVGVYASNDINGFATGPNKNNSLVALSTGCLRIWTKKQLAQ